MAKEIARFIYSTIYGHESGFYKIAADANNELISIDKLHNKITMYEMIRFATESYFNNVYERLVDKSDEYINNTFDKIIQITNHSPTCLINIIAKSCMDIHTTILIKLIDRKILDTTSYETYMTCIKNILDYCLNDNFITNLEKSLDHKCSGSKIVELLSNGQKMFKFEATYLYENRCAVCEKETKQTCSGCKPKKYYLCGVDCQKKDWSRHPSSCDFKLKQNKK
jgi:hypothetical protein